MRLVHDDGTILVQVRLPKRLPQENTVSHVLDECGLEGKEREVKGRREEVGEVHICRKRGRREKREEKMKLFKPGSLYHQVW